MEKTIFDNDKWEELHNYLKRNRLKMSQSRKLLYGYLLTIPDNLTMTEIHEGARNNGINVALSTLYRTVKILCEANILNFIRLDDGSVRYIQFSSQKSIRFICKRCKKIIFANERKLKCNIPNTFKNYNILQMQISYIGLCPQCVG